MGYRLGVHLGASFTTAAVRASTREVTVVRMPSVIHIDAGGEARYGGRAAADAARAPDGALRGYFGRIGDETPMMPGARTAHTLTADFVAWIVAQAGAAKGSAPDAIAVAHPATWAAHKRNLFADALAAVGLPGAHLVAEPVAVALAGNRCGELTAGSLVAVYDFGGRSYNVAVLRLGSGGWSVLGRPGEGGEFGGIDVDDAVLAHVLGNLSQDAREALAVLDSGDDRDPAISAAMADLRADCVRVKESLSVQTAATVAVALPGISTRIRLTRGELENLIADPVRAGADALDAAIDAAGVDPAELACVFLSGGSARIPLVTQLLSQGFGVPVRSADATDPALAVATGAVLALEVAPAGGLLAPRTRGALSPVPVAS